MFSYFIVPSPEQITLLVSLETHVILRSDAMAAHLGLHTSKHSPFSLSPSLSLFLFLSLFQALADYNPHFPFSSLPALSLLDGFFLFSLKGRTLLNNSAIIFSIFSVAQNCPQPHCSELPEDSHQIFLLSNQITSLPRSPSD